MANIFMRNRKQNKISIFLAVFLAALNSASAAEDSLTSTIMRSDAIKFRNAKSHAMHAGLQAPEGDGEPTVHVYLTLTQHAYPFVVSLGNFVVLKTKEGEVKVLDEFGEKIPLPNRQPERTGFHKGDLLALRSFDMTMEGKYANALKMIDQAINLAPNSYRLHNNRGVLLVLVGKPAVDAQKEFDEALKLNANCAAAYSNRACLYLSINKPTLAVDDANAALKIEPNLNPARLCLVRSNLEEGKKEDAAALLEKSGLSRKNDAQSLKLQAETLIANKEYKSARMVLRKLLMISTNDADAVLQLAYVSDMEGDLDEAIVRARQAVTMRPKNPGVREILGRYLEKAQDPAAAALQYEAAVDLLNEWVPKDRMKRAMAVEGALLRTIMRTNDFKRAEIWSKYFTKQFPTSASAHYNRAWLLSQATEEYHIKEALQEYDLALKLDPSLKQTHYNLALLSIKTGDTQRAESELKLFIELAPDDPDHESAKSMLAKLQAGK
jgi:Flp pilus assembly protein TadD